MDPIKMTELTKKYGSQFLLWCAIVFLYTDGRDTKNELKEVQSKLYTCLEIRANTSKNLNTNQHNPMRYIADLPKKIKYALKGIEKQMEI